MKHTKIIRLILMMSVLFIVVYSSTALIGRNVASELKTFIVDRTPPYFIDPANITVTIAYTTSNLSCTVLVNDSTFIIANMSWYVNGRPMLNSSLNSVTSNVVFYFYNLTHTNFSKGETVSCNVTVYDAVANTNTSSDAIVILNTLPNNITLNYPNSSSSDTSRRPFFNWTTSSDADDDVITYFLEIDNNSNFNSIDFNVTNLTRTNYTLDRDLNVDEKYYWRVRVYDQQQFSGYSEVWNYTANSYISIEVAGSINFGAGYVYYNNATAALNSREGTTVNGSWSFGSQNVSVINKGNVNLNIVATAPNATYWISPASTAEITGIDNSTNDGCSDIYSWRNLNETASTICSSLNYTNYTDVVASSLRVTIPENATAGAKSMQITYTASIP